MIAVVDYDMGNLRSLENALDRLGARYFRTSDPEELRRAEKVVLPGVGHAGKALEKIKDIPFRMYFVGTGYAADAMKDLVAEKGLDRQVTFVGMLTERADIVKYYAAADLFLFPSLYDNAPLVVREAAALNTPSVMVEGSTAATILKDGENGFLIPNDLDVFAAKLRELIHDPERVHRIGVQASRTIVRSWEDVVGEVLDRYNRLIARKKKLPLG